MDTLPNLFGVSGSESARKRSRNTRITSVDSMDIRTADTTALDRNIDIAVFERFQLELGAQSTR